MTGKPIDDDEALWHWGGEVVPIEIIRYLRKIKGAKRIADDAATVTAKKVRKGGAHKDIPAAGGQRHHMPAKDASHLTEGEGPAIRMETEDHMQTKSWGSRREAKAYREKQRKLIEEGKFTEAQQMDIDDVRSKFGNKYDDAIKEMQEYTDSIKDRLVKPKE